MDEKKIDPQNKVVTLSHVTEKVNIFFLHVSTIVAYRCFCLCT